MGLAGRLCGAETHRDMSEHVRTVVKCLRKAVACGNMWVQAGACRCGWVHVGGVSGWHVKAVGAHVEGPSTCIGGLGAAGCGRSTAWGHMEVSHMLGGT